MKGQHSGLFAPLVLVGILSGLVILSHGSIGVDEDYYMQDLLRRERYNQVQSLGKPLISDSRHDPSQNPAEKQPQGKAGRQTEKNKSGKHCSVFQLWQIQWALI